jgi:hypothetical protein
MSGVDSKIKEFNKSMKVFMRELVENFPHVELVKMLQTTFIVSKKLNKKIPRRVYNRYIAIPYRTQLANRDDAYFSSDDFKFVLWQSMVDSAKSEWRSLDLNNKEAIWNHLAVLCHINQQINSLKSGGGECEGECEGECDGEGD